MVDFSRPPISGSLEPVTTERLELRAFEADDLDGLAAVFANEEVWRFPTKGAYPATTAGPVVRTPLQRVGCGQRLIEGCCLFATPPTQTAQPYSNGPPKRAKHSAQNTDKHSRHEPASGCQSELACMVTSRGLVRPSHSEPFAWSYR